MDNMVSPFHFLNCRLADPGSIVGNKATHSYGPTPWQQEQVARPPPAQWEIHQTQSQCFSILNFNFAERNTASASRPEPVPTGCSSIWSPFHTLARKKVEWKMGQTGKTSDQSLTEDGPCLLLFHKQFFHLMTVFSHQEGVLFLD